MNKDYYLSLLLKVVSYYIGIAFMKNVLPVHFIKGLLNIFFLAIFRKLVKLHLGAFLFFLRCLYQDNSVYSGYLTRFKLYCP